ncbi:MAG TPA: ATP-binding protein [Polyangiaceae bacterium]|nr:ATP-binding protein [Polyangiaceae bacterium]
MALLGRTERRLAFAIGLVAVIPLIVSIYFANTLVDRAFSQAFTPELGEHLDHTLGVYQDLARSLKEGMRYQADAIAAREPLRAAALLQHPPSIQQELDAVFPLYSNLVSLGVVSSEGTPIVTRDRGRPVDSATEAKLEVRRQLTDEGGPILVAVFATPRARLDELERRSEFVGAYHQIERARVKLKRGDLSAFAVILAVTIVVAVAFGTQLARSVTRRIETLARATKAVGAGNLDVRVPVRGNDELTDLSRGFNQMLSEMEVNRARVEFLQRMSTWQEMARRLAHEIKNPLTPILLAVEECHRKYEGTDPSFRKLIDTTLEVVEEEVGTLRRLVGEFSSFARLPRAELALGDLGEFLSDQESHAILVRDELQNAAEAHPTERGRPPSEPPRKVHISFAVPREPMPVHLDRQMLRQVVSNILRNAFQAVLSHRREGRVEVSVVIEDNAFVINVDDDGPGVAESMRDAIFDPYVTTKSDGTGLGLAIGKKIVVEHGGTIDAGPSPLGGARLRIRIPRITTPAGRAVREASAALAGSGVPLS